MLDEGDNFGINRTFGASKKQFSINFSKAKTKFFLRVHYNGDKICLFIFSCLKVSVHDFSVDYNAIDKSDILNIHNYYKY